MSKPHVIITIIIVNSPLGKSSAVGNLSEARAVVHIKYNYMYETDDSFCYVPFSQNSPE